MRLRRSLILGLALAACSDDTPARDQWVVAVSTDVPVPALVDRALFEVLDDAGNLACADCRRVVGVPLVATSWPMSFGVISTGAKARVRIRLYPGARVDAAGLPLAASTLDRVVTLPAAHGVTNVGISLHGDCLGLATDTTGHQTCNGPTRALTPEVAAEAGSPALRPGTWSRAATTSCTGTAPDGMVCEPGGFFVLGDEVTSFDPTNDPLVYAFLPSAPQRFVTLRPFFLDVNEVTVGAVRALVNANEIGAPEILKNTPIEGCLLADAASSANDGYPVNCMSVNEAMAACAALGKRLPTEAEWELAAGNGMEKTSFPWGAAPVDACANADVGLGTKEATWGCRYVAGGAVRPSGLPLVGNPADVNKLGVHALAGGVAEMVADRGASYDAPCWHPDQPFLSDPRCDDAPTASTRFVVRGAGYLDAPAIVRATLRRTSGSSQNVGFRCAKDAF